MDAQKVRDLVDELMDEGVDSTVIKKTLRTLTDLPKDEISILVADQKQDWLTSAENRMKAYANEGSWQRLEVLLARYRGAL
jgi:hypothetical protein